MNSNTHSSTRSPIPGTGRDRDGLTTGCHDLKTTSPTTGQAIPVTKADGLPAHNLTTGSPQTRGSIEKLNRTVSCFEPYPDEEPIMIVEATEKLLLAEASMEKEISPLCIRVFDADDMRAMMVKEGSMTPEAVEEWAKIFEAGWEMAGLK